MQRQPPRPAWRPPQSILVHHEIVEQFPHGAMRAQERVNPWFYQPESIAMAGTMLRNRSVRSDSVTGQCSSR